MTTPTDSPPPPDPWELLVGDGANPGLLALFTVGVLGPTGTAVTRCSGCNTLQLFTDENRPPEDQDRSGPNLAVLVRGAVQHLECYHPVVESADSTEAVAELVSRVFDAGGEV